MARSERLIGVTGAHFYNHRANSHRQPFHRHSVGALQDTSEGATLAAKQQATPVPAGRRWWERAGE